MKCSWKKSIFTLFAGLLITGCATSKQKPTKRRLLMSDRGGLVPQPFVEPKAPTVTEEQVVVIDSVIQEPATPIIPAIVAPVEPIEPVKEITTQNTQNLDKYTVVKGDSLSKIAYRYKGFSYFELAKVNNLDVNKPLKIGQVLTIPGNGVKKKNVKTTPKKKETKVTPRKTSTKKRSERKTIPANGKYVVKSGDNLWLIAHRYGMTSTEIKSLNNLKSDTLHVGNVLILKGSGKSVAKPVTPKKQTATKEVQPLKPLTPEVVNVPVVQEETPAKVTPIEVADSPVFVEEVTIDEDNTDISTILEMFDVSLKDLQLQNQGVDLKNLKIGQVVKVPVTD